ncbi:MAG: hypothetical protein V4604_09800 [Bacteroidota bacterium]
MTKQTILKNILWLLTFLYLISLLLPYQTMHGGIDRISGFNFMIPLGGLVFITPYLLLVYLSRETNARIWKIVLASILLLYSGATFFIASIEILAEITIGAGAYLFVLVGIGFFVISLVQNKIPGDKQNDSRLLDQLP